MTFLGSMLAKTAGAVAKGAAGTAKTAWRANFSPTAGGRLLSTAGLAGIGAVAGGTAAAIGDDSNNPNLRFGTILRGAALGATAGAAVSGFGIAARLGKSGLAWNQRAGIRPALMAKYESQIAKKATKNLAGFNTKSGYYSKTYEQNVTKLAERRIAALSNQSTKTVSEWEQVVAARESAVVGPQRTPGMMRDWAKKQYRQSMRGQAGEFMSFANSPLVGSTEAFGSRLWNTGKSAGKMGLGLASFAIQHPVGIAAAGAGIYGLSYATRIAGPSSPTMRGAKVNTRYDRQAIAAQEMNAGVLAPTGMVGTMPMMARPMQDALQNSTDGLVQGLNRGRHG